MSAATELPEQLGPDPESASASGPHTVSFGRAPLEPRPQPFADTLWALELEQRGQRSRWIVGLLLVLACAWTTWVFAAHVQVYALSPARIEGRGIHPVVATASGRLLATRIELGLHVQAGDVVAELEQSVETKELEEARARYLALAPRISALQAELERATAQVEAERLAGDAAVAATRARLEKARGALAFAQERRRRFHASAAASSGLEVLGSNAASREARANFETAQAELEQTRRETSVHEATARANIDRLRADLAELEGLQSTAALARDVAERRLDLRRIHATHAGVIVESSGFTVGHAIREGDRVATLMSGDALRVVAEFRPEDAVGRIQPGQPGTLRLDGFPWGQYGTLICTVTQVAAEPTNGLVRVELVLQNGQSSAIPLQHGLVGSVEIAVASLTPAQLFAVMVGSAVSPAPGVVAPEEPKS